MVKFGSLTCLNVPNSVCVFRCNRCNSVHHPFTSSLRCPLEVHGVTTQTVNNNNLFLADFFVDTVTLPTEVFIPVSWQPAPK